MADAVITVVAERVAAIVEDQVRYEVNLVRGVEEEILDVSNKLETIRSVLDDAENRGAKEQRVKNWLKKLEDTAYGMDDILDEWDYALLKRKLEDSAKQKEKVCFSFIPSPSLCLKKLAVLRDTALKIQIVKATLNKVLKEKDDYDFVNSLSQTEPTRVQSTSSIELEKVCGWDIHRNKDEIIRKLMLNNGDSHLVLSIVGMGGLGKTTLAQLAFNDSQVENCFQLRIWICVSDPFRVEEIAKDIVASVGEVTISQDNNQLELVLQKLRVSISGKKFLLVLDDVWTEKLDEWEPLKNILKCGAAGSKIIVTTRKEGTTKMMGTLDDDIYRPKHLTGNECWSLLSHIALLERSGALLLANSFIRFVLPRRDSDEIGNLVRLRHLNLEENGVLKELPESICSLVELEILNIDRCWKLRGLPKGIHKLKNLQHLIIQNTHVGGCFPQGLAQLSGLRTLRAFEGGSNYNKLGLLKNLNRLSGSLLMEIWIRSIGDLEDLVEDAREAELKNKKHIQMLELNFLGVSNVEFSSLSSSLWMDVMEALEPNHNLKELNVIRYRGSRLPLWISSLNVIQEIYLMHLNELTSLPPLGKLPFLERLKMSSMRALEVVGREFLGIESSSLPSSSSSSPPTHGPVVAFPKLKKLSFSACERWRVWEDITAEEEESADLSIMPCLEKLTVRNCVSLNKLPRLLMRMAYSLQSLIIFHSPQLITRYGRDERGRYRTSIYQNNRKLDLSF